MLVQVLSLLAAASAVSAQSSTVTPAPQVTGNPTGVAYSGSLPTTGNSTLRGTIIGATGPEGKGVRFTVSISGLPSSGGPFMYHIHEKPVPSDGNCTGTGAHLDPYKRGEVPICDASKPETCQTGDLSGKFGNITAQQWSVEYVDPYSSTTPGTPSFFGDLSFVVHLSNKTRIGCANFTLSSGSSSIASISAGTISARPSATGGYNATVSSGMTTAPTTAVPVAPTATTSRVSTFTGAAAAAATMVGGVVPIVAAAAAFML